MEKIAQTEAIEYIRRNHYTKGVITHLTLTMVYLIKETNRCAYVRTTVQ